MLTTVIRPFVLAVVSLLAGCSETNSLGKILPFSGGAGSGIPYTVAIEGDIPSGFRQRLQDNSELVQLEREPPASRAALRRRISADVEGLRSVLRSEGYYSGTVEAVTNEDTEPVSVRLTVSLGPRYRLQSFEIVYVGGRAGEPPLPTDATRFGYHQNMPGRAADVVAISDRLMEHLAQSGRPKAAVVDRKVVVDHDTESVAVRLQVDPGPPARFGMLAIHGLTDVDEDYIRRVIDWPEGQLYDRRLLDAAQRKLIATNLFRSVHLHPADSVTPDGTLPVTADLAESKHRTIAAGINYSTDEGVGGELSWEHRNLSGRQERLRLSAEASKVRQQGSIDFSKPQFLVRDMTLKVNGTGRGQDTDAYKERTASGMIGLEKPFHEIWTTGIGVSADYSRIDEDGVESIYAVVGLPVNAARDGTDDILDPHKGTRLQLSATPYFATIENDVSFTVFEASGSAYFGLGKERRLVPAIRVRAGSIVGADTGEIPITKRFFAGGGGSVRGYEFQKAGPLDADGDPVGGRSVLETGFELRWRATNRVGFVPFIEGGNVYDGTTPDLGEDLFWATGLGLRYFTIAGPIRLDVAFPLNRRVGIDDDYQIYVSIGQAF